MGLKKESDFAETKCEEYSFSELIENLVKGDKTNRRLAAKDLAYFKTQSVDILLARLQQEQDGPVREAIFCSLQTIGGSKVVEGLLELLRLEDVVLRNRSIEALQTMPEEVAPHMVELLNDRDSDVRIFSIDILQLLAHPDTPLWLVSILKDETHINVVATALDRLSELGTMEMLDDLEAIKLRFPGDSFIEFAVDNAVNRIRES